MTIPSCVVLSLLLIDFLAEGAELKIFPEQNGIPLVRTKGKSFALTCQLLNSENGNSEGSGLIWDKDDSEIPLGSQGSVKAKKLGDKLMVYATKSDIRDSGTYTCTSGELVKEIRVIIIEPALWIDQRKKIGSPVGTRLTINCDAIGDPPPKIRITNKDSAPFSDERFSVTENTGMLTITKLEERDQDTLVVCAAAQTFTEGHFSYPIIQKKEISVDVYLEPQFESPKIDRYGIVGRNATLPCQVTKTNPAVTTFDFQFEDKGLEIPRSSEKYKIEEDVKNKKAILRIHKVSEEDFGRYICIPRNPQVTSSGLIISLSETNPPGPVQAKFMQGGVNSVSWEIDESEVEGSVPVTEYRVEYIRESLIKDKKATEIEEIWRTDSAKIHFKKAGGGDTLYRVEALRPKTTYRFRFRAVSEAGWGDVHESNAATLSIAEAATHKSGSPLSLVLPLPLLLIMIPVFCLLLS